MNKTCGNCENFARMKSIGKGICELKDWSTGPDYAACDDYKGKRYQRESVDQKKLLLEADEGGC